jgi:hypothetical protein
MNTIQIYTQSLDLGGGIGMMDVNLDVRVKLRAFYHCPTRPIRQCDWWILGYEIYG